MKIHHQKVKQEKEGGVTDSNKTGPSQGKVKVSFEVASLKSIATKLKKFYLSWKKVTCIRVVGSGYILGKFGKY